MAPSVMKSMKPVRARTVKVAARRTVSKAADSMWYVGKERKREKRGRGCVCDPCGNGYGSSG